MVFNISSESASSDTARASDIAEHQDRLLTLPHACLARKQTGNQLKVISDLFGGERAGPFIAARNLPGQRAEGTARARIVAVRFVQIVIDQLRMGYWRPAGCGRVYSTLPAAECGANRFGH
jgi:hypothetical protein